MADFDKDLIISLSKLLEKTGLSEIEIENKEVGRIKVAKNLISTSVLPSSPIPQSETNKSNDIRIFFIFSKKPSIYVRALKFTL